MHVSRDRNPASHEDLDFIAGARQDIPRLIAEIKPEPMIAAADAVILRA
jgi:hypothetical protein